MSPLTWLLGLSVVFIYILGFSLIKTAKDADNRMKDDFREYMRRKALIRELSGNAIEDLAPPHLDKA